MYKILKNLIEMDDYSVQRLVTGGSKRLPSGYIKADYIESNGTQYIDTGVIGKNGLDIYAKYKSTDIYQTRLMAVSTGETEIRLGILLSSSAGNIVNQYNKNNIILTDYVGDLTNIHTLENKDGTLIYDDTVVNQVPSETFTTMKNLYLFASNSASVAYSYVKMYEAFIKENNKLVRHFIPAVKKSRSRNLLNPANIMYNTSYDFNVGNFVSDDTSDCSGFVPVTAGTYLRIVNNTSFGNYYFQFDANKTPIRYEAPGAGNPMVIPNDVAYVVFNVGKSTGIDNVMFARTSTVIPYEPYEKKEAGMYDLSATSKNLFDINTITSGKGINGAGNIIDNENYFISDLIPVKQGNYTITLKNTYSGTSNTSNRVLQYDENKQNPIILYNYLARRPENVTIPLQCTKGYIQISCRVTDINIMLNEGTETLPYEPYQKRFYTNDGTGTFGYEYKGEKVEPTNVSTRVSTLNTANIDNTLNTDEVEPMEKEDLTTDEDTTI